VIDLTSQRRQWQHQRRPGILGIELPWRYHDWPIPRVSGKEERKK
jgi:hypothetical protein